MWLKNGKQNRFINHIFYELKLNLIGLSLPGLHLLHFISISYLAKFAGAGEDDSLGKAAVVPIDIHREVTLGTEPLDGTLLPYIRQGWQEMDKAHVTLHQHLGDTRCSAKVSVNLEWSVRIPEIVQCTILQEVAIKLVGMVAIMQTSPLVQLPTHRPTGCTIATMLQYHLGCLRQHRSSDSEMVRPGCRPKRWFTWRCSSLGSSISLDHSINCP